MVGRRSVATIMDVVLAEAAGILSFKVLAHCLCLCLMLEGKDDASLLPSPQPSPGLVQDQISSMG